MVYILKRRALEIIDLEEKMRFSVKKDMKLNSCEVIVLDCGDE